MTAQAVAPGEIRPAVVIGLCAGLGELPVHRDDAQRQLAGALDHRCLHRARVPANVRDQLGPRLAHQSRFPRSPITFRQSDWTVCREYPGSSCGGLAHRNPMRTWHAVSQADLWD